MNSQDNRRFLLDMLFYVTVIGLLVYMLFHQRYEMKYPPGTMIQKQNVEMIQVPKPQATYQRLPVD